jgi:hypothetical protein
VGDPKTRLVKVRHVKSLVLLLGAALLLPGRPALAQDSTAGRDTAAAKTAARASFDALKSLAGTWSGTVKTDPTNRDLDGPIHVTLRVGSQGNVIVHEIAPGGMPEPTLIYMEGDRLTLVHYCEAGNRPRLVARRFPDPKIADFELADISGSRRPLSLRHFVFTVIDPDHHTEDWTFVLESGQELRARFDLRRVAPGVAVPSGK